MVSGEVSILIGSLDAPIADDSAIGLLVNANGDGALLNELLIKLAPIFLSPSLNHGLGRFTRGERPTDSNSGPLLFIGLVPCWYFPT